MPVVKVEAEGEKTRVVRARSKNAAVDHVVAEKYKATIINSDELVDLIADGVTVEDAREPEKVVEASEDHPTIDQNPQTESAQ